MDGAWDFSEPRVTEKAFVALSQLRLTGAYMDIFFHRRIVGASDVCKEG